MLGEIVCLIDCTLFLGLKFIIPYTFVVILAL